MHPSENKLGEIGTSLYCFVTGFLIVSAFLHAIALRKFKKSLSEDKKIFLNQKTMTLHVIVLFFYAVAIALLQGVTMWNYLKATNTNQNFLAVAMMIVVTV